VEIEIVVIRIFVELQGACKPRFLLLFAIHNTSQGDEVVLQLRSLSIDINVPHPIVKPRPRYRCPVNVLMIDAAEFIQVRIVPKRSSAQDS
jgi:hypothetical protein